jgi:hypothetical protein
VLEVLSIDHDFIDHDSRSLHSRTSVVETALNFLRRPFKGAIETEGSGIRWTTESAWLNPADSRVGTIPLFWRIKNLPRAVNDPQIILP